MTVLYLLSNENKALKLNNGHCSHLHPLTERTHFPNQRNSVVVAINTEGLSKSHAYKSCVLLSKAPNTSSFNFFPLIMLNIIKTP